GSHQLIYLCSGGESVRIRQSRTMLRDSLHSRTTPPRKPAMPGFAKFLVFLNLLAAFGFLYIATQDYNARRPWAYEVFVGELAIDGLPVDRNDPGPRRVEIALFEDLDNN